MNNDSANGPDHRLVQRIATLERHVFEQDKEMLALSRQFEQLRGSVLGLRERLSEAGHGEIQTGEASHAHDAERPPHY